MNYAALGYGDVALAGLLVAMNAVLSMALGLKLEKKLAIAAVRIVVQLGLVALVLKALFQAASPWFTALAALIMVLFAGREAMARQSRRFAGPWGYGLGTASIMAGGLIVTVFALTATMKPVPWYDPRYALPILGMILGNTLTGVSLGLERLIGGAVRDRVAIEAQLALGRDFRTAIGGSVREALNAGMIPTINAMSAAGIVSLPGMMTGQILAGVDPIEAVKYQIAIMFLISGGAGLGLLAAVLAGARRLTDSRHRLRLDRLTGPDK